MEVWAPPDTPAGNLSLRPLDAVLKVACRLACGIRATPTEHSWQCRAGVKEDIMLTDMHVLPASAACDVAHRRLAERSRFADWLARDQRTHDPLSPQFQGSLPASVAPDYMGAAVRQSLAQGDMWVTRVNRVRGLFAPPPVHAGLVPRIANKDIRLAVERACTATRCADSPAAPRQPRCSRSGRVLRAAPVHRSSQYNPVTSVLTPAAPCPRYLLATDGITLPIMALRSAHLPGDYDQKAKQQYQLDHCICCDMEVISVQDCITDDERRWRHIQHVLTACRRRRQFWQPIMSQLRAGIHQVVGACQPARAALRVALCGDMDDLDRTRATCIPYFLDPVCESAAPPLVACQIVSLVAAYIPLVAAA
jgi:hypothetical protein